MGILLVWPALVLSLVTSGMGIRHRAPGFLLLGAALSLPAALYLGATPRFGLVGFLLPMCHIGGAVALARRLPWVPVLSMLAFVGLVAWVGVNVALRDPKAPLPQAPTVTAAGISVPVVLNRHCWDGGKVCAENLTPSKLVEEKGLTPTAVPSGSRLRLAFPVPPRSIQVDRWEGDRAETVPIEDDAWKAPEEPGVYTYSITADWVKRGAGYAVLVEVH